MSIVAPGKDLTVTLVLSSLFLTPFNMELPTSYVFSLIRFLVSPVRSTSSKYSFAFVETLCF